MKKSIRILTLEDNFSDYHLLRATLRTCAYDVDLHRTERLSEALGTLSTSDFDLVFTDLNVPDGAGLECVRAIVAAAPHVPLVVISGDNERETAVESLRIGAQDFIEKHVISAQVLERTIRYTLERHANTYDLARAVWQLHQRTTDLETFSNALSHDLRSPLLTIQGYATLAAKAVREEDRERASESIEAIQQTCAQAQEMIRGLLSLASVGHAEIDRVRVPLHEAVRNVREAMSQILDEAEATLVIEEHLPDVVGDAGWVRRVIENLVENAVKYGCAEPGGRIHIQARTEGDVAEIAVTDNGPGIPVDAQERVFEVFRRLHDDDRGTGIGLAICRRAIEELGGRIWVESMPGHGATFRFTLPYSRPDTMRLAA